MTELVRAADWEGCGKRMVSVRYEYDNTRTLLPSGAEIRREYGLPITWSRKPISIKRAVKTLPA